MIKWFQQRRAKRVDELARVKAVEQDLHNMARVVSITRVSGSKVRIIIRRGSKHFTLEIYTTNDLDVEQLKKDLFE